MKDRDRYVVLTQAYLLAENLTEAQYDEYADTAEALWWKMSVADREYCLLARTGSGREAAAVEWLLERELRRVKRR